MKKLLFLFLILVVVGSCKKDDTTTTPASTAFLASTTQQKKAAVLEDFTGVRCGYCPDGHTIAASLVSSYPGKVVVICVHTGSYADPAAGWANFTTSFGSAIAGQTGLTGYPAGTMNRHVFSGMGMTAGGTAMGRGNWTSAATQI
ncbi:MAG: hypothetical protein NTU73_05325, partial [Ignavibacteriae bacterium]|nr:hypothetical protein [Ignavibacteriota bacterium]